MTEAVFPARIIAVHYEAEEVLSFILHPMDNDGFPPVEPGAHVDVHLPNSLMRSYSLSNAILDKGFYRLTVARDARSKGGSVYMHDRLRVGQVLDISLPRNNFHLVEDAELSVFIAGGIGITPFVPMISSLDARGLPWRLHYSVRTRSRAAFLNELKAIAGAGCGEVLENFDGEPGGSMLDIEGILTSLPANGHAYCCGPVGMLDSFREAARALGIPESRVHYEYFQSNVERATEGGFSVVLAKTGKTLEVQQGQSILEVIIEAGVDISYSCEEGICGACEVEVTEGIPDHRDSILTDEERAASKTMMICCSGAKTPVLVLNI